MGEDSAEDSAAQEEGLAIVTAEDETMATGEEDPRQQEDRVVSEEDSEEGETLMTMLAGSEMIDPAADAMTTAPRLRALHRGTAMEANSGAMKALAEDAVINPAARDSEDRDPPATSADLRHVSISRERERKTERKREKDRKKDTKERGTNKWIQ